MVTFEDPVPMLEAIRLRTVPIAHADGADYYVDVSERCFREVKRSKVCVGFDSPVGRGMVADEGCTLITTGSTFFGRMSISHKA